METSRTFEQAEKFYNENKDRLIAEFLSEVSGADLDYQAEYDQVVIFGLCCQCSDMNGDGLGTAHYNNAGADDGFIDLVEMIASDARTAPLVAADEFWSKEYVREFAHDLARAIVDEFGVESYFECNREKPVVIETIDDAINHIADVMDLDTDGAHWVYENSDCPRWNDKDFANYDFLADECVSDLPEEFVK